MALFTQAHAAPDLGKALEGTTWRWDSYTLNEVTPEFKIKTPITLRFHRGWASWMAGCNGAGGAYLLQNYRLFVPKAVGTGKACGGGKSAVEGTLGSFMYNGGFVKTGL